MEDHQREGVFRSPMGWEENRIPAGCAIAGVFSTTGEALSGEGMIRSIGLMRERSNGLGGGFAGYGIYPDHKEEYAFHIFYDSNAARTACEEYLSELFETVANELLPTRKIPEITNEPLIRRYFLLPRRFQMQKRQLDETEFVARAVLHVNDQIDGAYVFSSGKNMGVFKAVGYPEDVGRFYALEDYAGYCWTAHGRYPTNTPGWWGGAHPFALLDLTVVHNGEISSYDCNRRTMEMLGYQCNLLTDTEVITYIMDELTRHQHLTYEEAARVMAAPFWTTIAQMPSPQKEEYTALRQRFSDLLITGPFSLIVGFTGGMMILNDRLKLRSMVTARKGTTIYTASEESAIRAICPDATDLFAPAGGQPVIYRLTDEAAARCL